VPNGAGEEPRVQQQVVPLSAWDKAPPATPAAPGAPPAPGPDTNAKDDGEADDEATTKLIEIVARDTARQVFRDAA